MFSIQINDQYNDHKKKCNDQFFVNWLNNLEPAAALMGYLENRKREKNNKNKWWQ